MRYIFATETVVLGQGDIPLAYPVLLGDQSDFGPNTILKCASLLLTKREHNNGVGRNLLRSLRRKGAYIQMSWDPKTEEMCGFFIRRAPSELIRFNLYLFGKSGRLLLNRLNGEAIQCKAIEITKERRKARRKLKQAGLWRELPKVKQLRDLAGASQRLKRHFRNSTLTWSPAVDGVAYAVRKDTAWIHKRLLYSMDERGVATLRTEGDFVFRIDCQDEARLPNTKGAVELRTTNDNRHGAYRRLRTFLHRHFECGKKHRENKKRVRAWRKRQQTLRILAAAGMAA